jgi:methylmalonyl-CoA mutase C-terminal domain/subunit
VAVDALQRAGFEVIYTGIRQTPEAIVAAAVQEAVDAIGLVGVGQDELEIADLAQQRL